MLNRITKIPSGMICYYTMTLYNMKLEQNLKILHLKLNHYNEKLFKIYKPLIFSNSKTVSCLFHCSSTFHPF